MYMYFCVELAVTDNCNCSWQVKGDKNSSTSSSISIKTVGNSEQDKGKIENKKK